MPVLTYGVILYIEEDTGNFISRLQHTHIKVLRYAMNLKSRVMTVLINCGTAALKQVLNLEFGRDIADVLKS